MSDYSGKEAIVKFSSDLPRIMVYASAIAEGMNRLSGPESRIVGEVVQCLANPHKKREISLNGLTRTGQKHLREMLDRHNVDYTYVPLCHHYRAPSEPARLVVNAH